MPSRPKTSRALPLGHRRCLLGCSAIGTFLSLPVLLRPIALDTCWPTTGISAVMA